MVIRLLTGVHCTMQLIADFVFPKLTSPHNIVSSATSDISIMGQGL
jgi:hypothetical protein